MKTFKMLLLAIAALCVTACENDEAAYIGVPESIELSADASIIDFVVNSNSNWTLTVSDPWFKITPKHGSGKTTLKLGVDRNVTGAERTSTLEFTSADGSIERVPVSQPAYVAEMDITAAQTVLVKKGEQLTLKIAANVEDWVYTLADGAWLKEASKSEEELVFDLDPSVKFDTNVTAKITFTSPSDPVFEKTVEVRPLNFAELTASGEESVTVKRGEQYTVKVTSNIDDWTYTITDGAWMREASKTATEIIFDMIPTNLVNANKKAKITFSSPSYANLPFTMEVQPISFEASSYLPDKSKMRAFTLENDGTENTAEKNHGSAYLFDGMWQTNKGNYHLCNIEGADFNYKHWEINTTVDSFNAGHGDSFTIDAGEAIRLARFISYPYWSWANNDPLAYEIYAYTGDGEPEAAWDKWVKLGSVDASHLYEDMKGVAAGAYSALLADGITVVIPEDNEIVARYYRFKMQKNGYAVGKTELNQWWTGRIHWMTLSEATLVAYE